MTFECREDPDDPEALQILLPPVDDLDAQLGTEKWMVRQAESEALGLNAATQIGILGPKGEFLPGVDVGGCNGNDCGDHKLSW